MRCALLLAAAVAAFAVATPATTNADDKWEHIRERQKKWEEYQREGRKKAEEHARKIAEFERERYKKQREYDREWWQKQSEFERESWKKANEYAQERDKKQREYFGDRHDWHGGYDVPYLPHYDEDADERLRERDEARFEWLEEQRERELEAFDDDDSPWQHYRPRSRHHRSGPWQF